MKVLVTGCAGFLGYHICDELLKINNSTSIIGVDSINYYYSQGIKKKRLKDLKKKIIPMLKIIFKEQ